ncbi:recombinase family protein [Micromonospora carbonacea]|uniref:recombinase family protein n=1 Tax=Micromonospora carbonacea TaxID=47853 RepID=UPI0037112EB1
MPPNARTFRGQNGPNQGRRSRDTPTDAGPDEWIIYVRISDDREGRGLGVARQEKAGRQLHKRADLGGTILTVLCDNDMTAYDKSGRYKPRPDYDQLCELLRERPGRRGVIAWHTDRLHRTPRELEDFIDLVEETAAPVRTVEAGPIDLTTPSGRAVARTLCAWARFESEHKSQRVRDKVREQAEAGAIYGGGPRPYGYTRVYDGEGPRRKIVRDEINPEEAAIVRECARRLLSGDTVRSVVRWLNGDGIKTSTGRPWSQQALRLMMMSGRIAGLREHHGEVVAEAVWKPIITVEQHEQLRALLASNERSPGSRVRKHYLSGFVYCSDCADKDVKMRVCPQHGKLKYKCLSDVGGCNGRVIGLADLEELIGAVVVAHLRDPRTLASLAAREADQSVEAAALVERIEAGDRRLGKLQAALDDGDDDDLPEVVASIRRQRKKLDDLRAQLGRTMTGPAVPRESFQDLAERWEDLDLDKKRTLLAMFVDRILIYPAVRGRTKFDPMRVRILPVRSGGARLQVAEK